MTYIGNPFERFDEDTPPRGLDIQADIIDDFLTMVWPYLRHDPDITQVIQINIRDGMPLLEHLLQGVGFILSIAPLLEVADDECWIRRAITAFILHDLNKLRSEQGSLSRIVRDDATLKRYVMRFGLDKFLGLDELPLQTLRFLIENASEEHGKRGSALLGLALGSTFNPEQHVRDTVPVIQAADIHDLSKTLDERRFKDRVANHLARLTGERISIIRCRVAEHRGALTQLIQQACEQCLEEAGAVAGWVYPDGSAYLTMSSTWHGDDLPLLDLIKARFIELRQSLLLPDNEGIRKQFKAGKDGLKIPLTLCLLVEPERLAEIVCDWSINSNLTGLRATLDRRRLAFNENQGAEADRRVLEGGWCWEHELDAWLHAGRIFRAAENVLKQAKKHKPFKQGTKAWPADVTVMLWNWVEGADKLSIEDLADTDSLYERPFIVGGNLPGGIQQATRLIRYALECVRALASPQELRGNVPELTTYLDSVVQLEGYPARHPIEAHRYLRGYLEQSPYRSSLGAAQGKAKAIKNSDVGNTFGKVSQFSNVQAPGRSDPKRRADQISQHALMIQRIVNESGASVPLYVHVAPRVGMSVREWRDVGVTFGNLKHEDQGSRLLLNETSLTKQVDPDWGLKRVGLVVGPPTRSELWSNTLTLPFYPPGEGDTIRHYQAILNAAVLTMELRTCTVVSRTPYLAIPPSEGERLRIENCPASLQGLLQRASSFDGHALPRLIDRLRHFVSLERMLRADIKKDLVVLLATSLSKGFLSLIYTVDRMVERKHAEPTRALTYDTSKALAWARVLIPESSMSEHDRDVMSYIEALAEVAFKNGLTPQGYKRNQLLRPMNEFFKQLRRRQPPIAVREVLASSEDRIFTAIETVKQREPGDYQAGRREQQGAAKFVSILADMIEHAYKGDLNRLRAQERQLKSCYITAYRALIQKAYEAKQTQDNNATGDAA